MYLCFYVVHFHKHQLYLTINFYKGVSLLYNRYAIRIHYCVLFYQP
jgi:hypothetical protein